MIRFQKSRVMLLVANVMQQIKYLLKLIVVLLRRKRHYLRPQITV
jgi:hypothetical protein